MRTTDALGISGNRQKRKDRRDADHLEKRLCKRQREDRGKLTPAVWPREKENATDQVGNVMKKPGQGGSELHVQEKWRIASRNGGTANYLRERL